MHRGERARNALVVNPEGISLCGELVDDAFNFLNAELYGRGRVFGEAFKTSRGRMTSRLKGFKQACHLGREMRRPISKHESGGKEVFQRCPRL